MRFLLCSVSLALLSPASVVTTQPQDTTASTPTVAVAVQRSATNLQQSSYVIAHSVCFSDSNGAPTCEKGDPSEDESMGVAVTACCDAMKRAVRFLCLQAQTQTGRVYDSPSFLLSHHSICQNLGAGNDSDSTAAASWEYSCAEHIASVPSYMYYSPGIETEDESMVPTHMLSIWDEESGTATSADGEHSNTNDTERTFGVIGEQYVWDEMSGGRWHSATSSPFLIASLDDTQSSGTDSPHAPPPPSSSSSSSSLLPAKIISSVSELGGMHRTHGHRIVLSMGQIIDAGASEASGNVSVLLPLSEALFMDIDDALQDDGYCTIAHMDGQCKAEMVSLPRGEVVDIEQPSFASRQHVLAIRVSFELRNLQQQSHLPDVALEFASKLHLRYQAPIATAAMEKGGQRMMSIHVPSTFVGGGYALVVVKDGEDGGDSDGTTSVYSIVGGQVQRNALVVEASTGHDGDYIFVVAATLSFAVIGSLAMIRYFSSVSRWV